MFEIIGVRFKGTNKSYYFNPNGIQFEEGDGVIVETSRGVEYGHVSISNSLVEDEDVVQPLKEIIRKATDKDTAQLPIIEKKRKEGLKIAQEVIEKHNLVMKLVDLDYTFDMKKAVFYYTADGRVDFRELVKDLASRLRTRIEMRQIYERDDIKMRGALASCGRPCCCSMFLGDYDKVSLKMAKLQGLSLNPTKVNGVCGKLMCCLRFENETYQKASKKMPPLNSSVMTPDGEGVVVSQLLLKESVKVRVIKDDLANYIEYGVDEITPCAGKCPAGGCKNQQNRPKNNDNKKNNQKNSDNKKNNSDNRDNVDNREKNQDKGKENFNKENKNNYNNNHKKNNNQHNENATKEKDNNNDNQE